MTKGSSQSIMKKIILEVSVNRQNFGTRWDNHVMTIRRHRCSWQKPQDQRLQGLVWATTNLGIEISRAVDMFLGPKFRHS